MMSKWVRSVNLQISQLVIVQDGDQERSYSCNNVGTNWIKIVDGNTAGRVSPEEEEELQGLYKQFLAYKENPVEKEQPKKFCKDCKYLWGHRFCDNPRNGIDPVLGRTDSKGAMRLRKNQDLCGPEAKWFVQKEPEVKRKWWKLWQS